MEENKKNTALQESLNSPTKSESDHIDSDVVQIQRKEFLESFDIRLKELGFDRESPDSNPIPSKSILEVLGKETGVDWRTLRNIYKEGQQTLNSNGMAKRYKAFKFIHLNILSSSTDLVQILESRHWFPNINIQTQKAIITNYGYPKNQKLSEHLEGIKVGLNGIRDLWHASKELPTDQMERLDQLSNFEDKINNFFKKIEEKKITIFYGKVPSFIQPPPEILDDRDRNIYSIYLFFVASIPKPNEDSVISYEIDWKNLIR